MSDGASRRDNLHDVLPRAQSPEVEQRPALLIRHGLRVLMSSARFPSVMFRCDVLAIRARQTGIECSLSHNLLQLTFAFSRNSSS